MKRTQVLLACALVLALSGANLVAAEEGIKKAKPPLKPSWHRGYLDNGSWLPARVNMKLAPGAALRTGADGSADLSVNGLSSALRMTNNTVLRIPTMTYVGTDREGDRTTTLNLETGAIIGNVKKITANSRYEIMTPHGVAGIRGTDYGAATFSNPDGTGTSTFSSISGTIQAVGNVNGTMQVFTLHTGDTVTFGGLTPPVIQQLNADILQFYRGEIDILVQIIFGPGNGPGHGPGGIHGPRHPL